jgi:3-hydroxyisobutyrate dehydrogenase-like beta-hydroxyacid dehydrogenase
MKVGFLGFGEVASNISKWLKDGGVGVYTSMENRSDRTKDLAFKSGINICEDNKSLAKISDILISAVTPDEAVNIAREIGGFSRGVYVDINNISPETVHKTMDHIKNGKTADAAIMGGIKKEGIKVQIIASGNHAEYFSQLNHYGLNIKVISPRLGQSKALKMLRSAYTKGVSALLFESLYSAYKLDLDEEMLECLKITEGHDFIKSAVSRIISSAYHARRRTEEMDEVVCFLSQYNDPIMSKATTECFKNISKTINQDNMAKNYKDVFKSLK